MESTSVANQVPEMLLQISKTNMIKLKNYPLKRVAVAVCILLLALLVGLYAALFLVSSFFDKYKLVFQQPVIFQAPLVIKERNPENPRRIKDKAPSRVNRAIISQKATPTLPPFRKYLTIDASKTREKVLAMAKRYYSGDQLIAFDNILKKEAGYRVDAVNEIGACGMGQANPCSKMNCPLDESGIECQFQWIVGYINRRYGDPLTAWNFHLENNWY